jgi:cytidine deaminase
MYIEGFIILKKAGFTRITDKKYKIKSPCGICRELIIFHYPDDCKI